MYTNRDDWIDELIEAQRLGFSLDRAQCRHFAPVTSIGGAEEDRTPDLRIANATLSQLSYGPTRSN